VSTPRDATQAGFVPQLEIDDALARYWMRSAMLRLRREICWRWHLADARQGVDTALAHALDLTRNAEAKAQFMKQDAAAMYLTGELRAAEPSAQGAPRGSFGWLAKALELDSAARFVLGLGMLSALDHGAGPVIAECTTRRDAAHPTLALAQLLWERPTEMIALADAGHVLWRLGVLQPAGAESARGIEWEGGYNVAPPVARVLAFPDSPLPGLLEPIAPATDAAPAPPALAAAAARLRATSAARALRVVALAGAFGADFEAVVAALARINGRRACRLHVDAPLRAGASRLRAVLAVAWLRDVDVLVIDDAPRERHPEAAAPYAYLNDLRDLPLALFVAVDEAGALPGVADDLKIPAIEIPRLAYAERVALWSELLRGDERIDAAAIAECARRFRFEPVTIRAAAAWLHESPTPDAGALVEACRAAAPLEVGGLAERVIPRFQADELVLAPPLKRQFHEIRRAMQALGDVHYRWGTARAWNEGGLSVLLCGPPGCGKTMFAEALAEALTLPMYRIDLSQVVNKYIGETEKNLKRLFDAADIADAILFFDEADAIFGKRIDVRDAHDRYANLEVSYLLARMERFKGLAILATNRRRDLDEAFLRRLRMVVELPLPESRERTKIWRLAVPGNVDGSELDFDFLGRQFNLSGGHIRSAVLNACLLSAAGQREIERPRLGMEPVIAAVKREFDKLKRSPAPERFGPFAQLVRDLDHG
jgi:hypothetical protein